MKVPGAKSGSIRTLIIVVGLLLAAISIVTALWGAPVPSSPLATKVNAIVAGSYSPSDRFLTPTKIITNTPDVSILTARLNSAPQRLVLPVLGTLRGPAILLSEEGVPLAAIFYQTEHHAIVAYDVRKDNNGYTILGDRLTASGLFQKAYSVRFFEDAKNKWQILTNK